MIITPLSPVFKTLLDLVRINSVNPAFEGGQSEAEIIRYIQDFFQERQIETFSQEVYPNRCNLVARLPGKNATRRLLLEAHVDTAPVKGMSIPPFDPVITEERLYGRGACDNKGGLAAMMHALAAIKLEGRIPPCEVWLVASVDEEAGFGGVVRLCQDLRADAAIVAEPTSLQAVIASKGTLRWKFITRGRSAHSSKPHLGINAITHMSRLVLAIEEENRRLASVPHPLLGPATGSIGLIQGGVQVNIVPDSCSIEIDRRLLPGETVENVLDTYRQLLARLKLEIPQFDAVMEPPMLIDEPLDTSANSPVAILAAQVLNEMGLGSSFGGVPFCSDAGKLSHSGIPSILFGPGSIDRAHAAVEYVECDEVVQAVAFYRRFIERFD